jgi:subtilisin family serine protease
MAAEHRSAWSRWEKARALRLGIAALLLVVALGLLLVPGLFEVCDDQLARRGQKAVVEVCRRPAATDPAVLVFLLLMVVSLWPDISDVSVGVFKLTRKVDEQVERTEDLVREVQILGLDLRQTIAQSQRQEVNLNLAAPFAGPAPVEQISIPPEERPAAPERTVGSRPEPKPMLEELLAPVREQEAYRAAGLEAVRHLLEGRTLEPVRLAIVGAGIDPHLRDVSSLGSHLEALYTVAGAAPGAPQQVQPVGNVSVGHVLAVTPTAVVSPVGVLGPTGVFESPSALRDGIVAALVQRPQVLLIGLGGPSALPEVEQLLTTITNEMLVVAPAGNQGVSSSVWPGIVSGVVSVAALTTSGERAPFSNYGTGVDLAAPGVTVKCLLGITADAELQFGELSGTTVSADIVAAVAALLLATGRVHSGEVLEILRQTASAHTSEGLPVLNAEAAVQHVLGHK